METGTWRERKALMIEKINDLINDGDNVELRKEQLESIQNSIEKLERVERHVKEWESKNHKNYNGSAVDVDTYEDVVDYANEISTHPLQVIADGVYTPVKAFAGSYSDMNNYYYLLNEYVEKK